jgi:hypothetical protein
VITLITKINRWRAVGAGSGAIVGHERGKSALTVSEIGAGGYLQMMESFLKEDAINPLKRL